MHTNFPKLANWTLKNILKKNDKKEDYEDKNKIKTHKTKVHTPGPKVYRRC